MEEKKRRTVQPHTSPVDLKAQKRQVSRRRQLEKKTKVTDIKGYRKRKRRAGNTRWVRLLLLFITCMVGGYYFALSPFFAVRNIVVSGNCEVSAQEVQAASGVKQGDNIFAVSGKRSEQWVKINYLVATAQIEKKLPDTIIITVTERVPAANVPVDGGFLQIDKEGVVLARLHELDKAELPLITGLGNIAAGSVPGTKLKTENMGSALSVISQMDSASCAFITELNVRHPQKLVVYTKDNTEVRIGGSEQFMDKYLTMNAILQAQEEQGLLRSIAYLDVSLFTSPAIFYSR